MEERDFARYAFIVVVAFVVLGLLFSDGGISGYAAKKKPESKQPFISARALPRGAVDSPALTCEKAQKIADNSKKKVEESKKKYEKDKKIADTLCVCAPEAEGGLAEGGLQPPQEKPPRRAPPAAAACEVGEATGRRRCFGPEVRIEYSCIKSVQTVWREGEPCGEGTRCENGDCVALPPPVACTMGPWEEHSCPNREIFYCEPDVLQDFQGTGVCRQKKRNNQPCVHDVQCGSNLCRQNEQGAQVCVAPYQLGSPCRVSRECASEICGRNEQGIKVCIEPRPFDSACDWSSECASGLCVGVGARPGRCRNQDQPLGSVCIRTGGRYSYECASRLCGMNEQGQRVCEEPNQQPGSSCSSDQECASGVCGRNEQNQMVCEEPNQPLGSVCAFPGECAPNGCGSNEQGARVCIVPFSSPLGRNCVWSEECASRNCGDGVCA